MASRLRELEETGSPLGPPSRWPAPLKSALSICIQSSFPTAIYWGEDLRLFYNDAWAPIPAERHPWAVGRPAKEVWADAGVARISHGPFPHRALMAKLEEMAREAIG